MNPPSVVLRPGRERSVGLRHPWLLSGGVDRVEGSPAPGDVVEVRDAAGARLGTGDWDPDAQIRVRLFAFGKDLVDEAAWLETSLERALAWRRGHPLLLDTDALRLVRWRRTGCPPGLTVNRYGDWLCLRVGTPAMLRRAPRVAEILAKLTGARGAWLRAEGAPGTVQSGDVPVQPITITERGRRYQVEPAPRSEDRLLSGSARRARPVRAPGQGRACARLVRAHRRVRLRGPGRRRSRSGGGRVVGAGGEAARENAPGCEIRRGDVNEFLHADARASTWSAWIRRRSPSASATSPPHVARTEDLNLRVLRRVADGAHVLTLQLLAPRRVGAVSQSRVLGRARRGPRSADTRGARRARPTTPCHSAIRRASI